MTLLITHPNTFSQEQHIFKSDRVILNSVKNDILLVAKNIVAIGAENDIHLNAGNNLYLNTKTGKIILGKPTDPERNGDQQMILGDNLISLLEDVLQLLRTFQVTTPVGEGQAGPKVSAKVSELSKKYFSSKSPKYILSDIGYLANNKK